MDSLIKVSLVRKRMGKGKDLPSYNRVYDFFMGTPGVLKKKEIDKIKQIVTKDHEELMKFLNEAEPVK